MELLLKCVFLLFYKLFLWSSLSLFSLFASGEKENRSASPLPHKSRYSHEFLYHQRKNGQEQSDPRDSRHNWLHLFRNTSLEVVGDNFLWAEGPVWSEAYNGLLFSDTQRNSIFLYRDYVKDSGKKVTAKNVVEFLKHSGTGDDSAKNEWNGRIEVGSNGLTIVDGKYLLIAQHGKRQIVKLELPQLKNTSLPLQVHDWEFETVINEYGNVTLNSPNDLSILCNSLLLFTDPPYGLQHSGDSFDELNKRRNLRYSGIFAIRLGQPSSLQLLSDKVARPNGIAISKDKRWIYVSDSLGSHMFRWLALYIVRMRNEQEKSIDVFPKPFLLVTEKELRYANFHQEETIPSSDGGTSGNADGMLVEDSDGLIFATAPGSIVVMSPPR